MKTFGSWGEPTATLRQKRRHLPPLSKYRMLARLGSGGMAEVYLVLAEGPGGFHKLQVVKLMRPDLGEQERVEFLRMFQDEARLVARLSHANIVQSYEAGSDHGQPFIVMEYLDGQPLARVQQRARSLGDADAFPLELSLQVLCEVLEGLDYAHRLTSYEGRPLGIVHRDVSPQNVFITYAGVTKLVDFGIAKSLESGRTRAGVVKGKVAYMAPEQVLGAPLDRRADLFAVGVLLWEAIARQDLYDGRLVFDSLQRLARGEIRRIRDVAPDVPTELERIVTRALARDPDERYQDAESFRYELLSYLESTSKVRGRDVGERVAQLFCTEREALQTVIRHAMRGDPGPLLDPRVLGPLPGFANVVRHEPTRALARSAEPPVRVSALALSKPAMWTLAALGLAAAGWMVRTPRVPSVPPPVPARATAAPRAPALAAVPAPAPRADGQVVPSQDTIHVEIDVEPREALLVLDGVVLGTNPYAGRHARDERAHLLQVTAAGFETQRRELRFQADQRLHVQLAATPRASDTRARPRGARAHASRDVDLPPPRRPVASRPTLDARDPWDREPEP